MPDNVTRLVPIRRIKRVMSDFYGDKWGCFNQVAWADLVPDREMTGETWRVLMAIFVTLDKGNHVRVRALDLAEIAQMHPSNVTVQIKKLVKRGVMLPGERYGWRLNPRYGFKGEPDKSLRRAQGGELVLVD